ncbi:ribosomal large subunit pseudouridine synthase D [Scopulibacillus darangshiensis]|uniref:Pseudouridine synthase n=1 Tax=Scopulibacillus darangshiensis TaxID=442528 RepID=A0A4R2P378_9BACL|nr:RluA family pseudouridine synthase [Scopulibacillus darangshiensis]TCP29112.1 ribosomal large subunit pseudouridine synthase D [Scopulibacillus darangshiensis]
MEINEKTVTEEHHGERLDKWVNYQISELSRTRIQDMIKDAMVTVNGRKVKPNYRVNTNDHIIVKVSEPEPLDVKPENIPLDIIFEDDQLLVVNKPRGMVVHPAPGHVSGTLVNALVYHCKDLSGINGVARPGIVHRIDKDTSGLLVVAKTDQAHQSLASQLKAKTTHRIYQAIVHGVVSHDKGTIEAPIGRDEKDRKKMAVTHQNSKDAVTHFTVEERFAKYTFVRCQLETGRTHQIRVHMDYIGHPVAGDPKYGPKKTLDIDGQALHASELGFRHPVTDLFITFSAPLPKDMNDLLNKLRERG